MKRSLSLQLTVLLTIVTSGLLLAFWFSAYEIVSQRLRTQNLERMKERLSTVNALLESETTDPTRLKLRVEDEWAKREFDRIYVRIRNADGSILTETPGKQVFDSETVADISQGRLTRFEVGDMILVGAQQLQNAGDRRYLVEIAFDRTSEADLMRFLRESFLIVFVVGLLISIIGARVFAHQALAPVRRISGMASSVTSTSLRERIDASTLPTEFGELATTLNGMLSRLEDSFDRLSHFSSDMAHELRTPVSNMLSGFGVALSQPRTPNEYADVLESGIEDCERLRRIIDSLLFIARSNNPQIDVQMQNFDLRTELAEIIEFYEISADEAGIRLVLEMSEDVSVRAEKTLFQRAVGNLISNSIRHSPRGSEIRVSVESRDARSFVTVADRGTGIDEALIPQIGERFFRPDPSRSSASGGTGLGLSIVKSIAKIHGGRFDVRSRLNDGTRVTLDFQRV